MSIMTNNDCVVNQSFVAHVFEKAGIIDIVNKTLLIITGENLVIEYNKVLLILLNSAGKDVKQIYFKICPMSTFTNIYGWLIKNNVAYSFVFSYNIGQYIDLNLDFHFPLRKIPNYGPPLNNRINTAHFTRFPVAFLCLNAVGVYSIKYLKP